MVEEAYDDAKLQSFTEALTPSFARIKSVATQTAARPLAAPLPPTCCSALSAQR